MNFLWKGEPIADIRAWAKERGEKLVFYRLKRMTPWGPESRDGFMPETFWNCMRWDGYVPHEIRREEP